MLFQFLLSVGAIIETGRDVRPHLPNRPDLYAVSEGDAKGASDLSGAG